MITGSQDSLTPFGDAEELAELIPHARLEVLSGAAHGLMVEAPNAFNDAVLRFLGEVDGLDAAIDEPRGRIRLTPRLARASVARAAACRAPDR